MTRIQVCGMGAVSPAGWGVGALDAAMSTGVPLPIIPLPRPGRDEPLRVRTVPAPAQRPACLAHPRLRRASSITQHTVAAALEALADDAPRVQGGALRLGIVTAMMPGCVTYSRRFYEEVLKDPAVASPLLFPETVFNAPGSHLAAFLNSTAASYTLVGDETSYVQGLAIAAGWLTNGEVDAALVIGVEELDWIIAEAARLFNRDTVQTGGAGALYLKCSGPSAASSVSKFVSVELKAITDAIPFANRKTRRAAAAAMRAQLTGDESDLLCLSTQGFARMDADELAAWSGWRGPRRAPRELLGDAFTASAAWQCIVACAALQRGEFPAANVSVVGTNAQAIGARFQRGD